MKKESEVLDALNVIAGLLANISTANGYNHNPSIKRGWLEHIFAEHQRVPVSFPVVTYRPALSSPDGRKTGNSNITDTVSLVIVCAAEVLPAGDPVADLLNLMKDVRRSLVFDPFNNRLGISEIEFMECPFDLPDESDKYIVFSQTIRFKVTEQYA